MVHQSILRKSLVGVILALTLVLSLVGVLSNIHAQTSHAAGTNTVLNSHSILPHRFMSKYARKMKAVAPGVAAAVPAPACLTASSSGVCYSPQQIRSAYNIQPLLDAGDTGAGHTIVIIDQATSSTLRSDLHQYDQLFGLNDPTLNVFSPFSRASTNQDAYTETALDVEISHALAPNATIDLVLANVDNDTTFNQVVTDLLQATNYAVQNNLGDVISQSFGVGESCVSSNYIQQEQQVFAAAQAKGITVLASSGDQGATVLTCANANTPFQDVTFQKGVNVPAADPLVTSVGGTTLTLTGDGQYGSETTWNEDNNGDGATGGGISTLFSVPSYQQGIAGLTNRGVPDVAFDADPLTGVAIVLTQNGTTESGSVGGTSVGSPAWAGIVALLNQKAGHRLGFLNPAIYAISAGASYGSAFHDITTGNNSVNGKDANGNPTGPVTGFSAGPGYDLVTGVGSPIADGLATALTQ